jgi:hypothetical protein
MISIEHEDQLTIVGIFGEFNVADYRKFEEEVSAQLKDRGQLNLLIDLTGMLEYTLDVALEDIRFSREHAKDVGRIAIISEQEMVAWLAMLTALFIDTDIKVFDAEVPARTWLAEGAG